MSRGSQVHEGNGNPSTGFSDISKARWDAIFRNKDIEVNNLDELIEDLIDKQ